MTPHAHPLRRFFRDTNGSFSVEAVIIFPVLLVLFAVSWVFFDVMRQQSVSQKANYTISDMISRETEVLDDTYVTNARNLLALLTKSQAKDVDLRISVVQYDASKTGPAAYELIWSEARGNWNALEQADMTLYSTRLPEMANADQVIVVETRDWYVPTFRFKGIEPFFIQSYSFTRPRFAPQVVYQGVNDGSGAGTGGSTESNPA